MQQQKRGPAVTIPTAAYDHVGGQIKGRRRVIAALADMVADESGRAEVAEENRKAAEAARAAAEEALKAEREAHAQTRKEIESLRSALNNAYVTIRELEEDRAVGAAEQPQPTDG